VSKNPTYYSELIALTNALKDSFDNHVVTTNATFSGNLSDSNPTLQDALEALDNESIEQDETVYFGSLEDPYAMEIDSGEENESIAPEDHWAREIDLA